MAPASKHRAASRPEHAHANYASRHLHSGRGAGCRNFSRLPARGRAFSLDIVAAQDRNQESRKFSSGDPIRPPIVKPVPQPWPPSILRTRETEE